MAEHPRRRFGEPLPEPKLPWWWKLWFAFCALFGLTMAGLVVWLIVEGISWLRRN